MEFLAVAISTLSAVTSGLAFGFSSSTTMQIYFTVSKSTFFTSSLNIGGLVGSLISVPMLNAIGRRFTLLVSCMASAMGWFWMYMCSDAVYEFSFPISLFILGRLLTGIGAGLCIPSVAVYMLEISSPRYRGMVGALPQVGIVTGICISFFLAIFMVWERIVFTSIIFSCVVLVLVWYLPESPKRLRSVRCPQDADNVDIRLSGTRSSHSTDTENNSIEATTKKHSFMVYMCPCSFIPSNQQPRLRMAIMLMIFQQLTGINAILFYAESVCLISSAFSPPVCAFYIGLFQMIFTIVAAFVINIVRRKKLLMLSAVIMAISQLAYAITISANVPSFTVNQFWIILFIFGYSFGWGPLPILISMELFPIYSRDNAVSSIVIVNWLFSFIITSLFELITYLINPSYIFIIFSFFCLISIGYVYKYLPETSYTVGNELSSSSSSHKSMLKV